MFLRAGSSLRGVTDWFSRVGRTLKVAFPTANVKVRRQPDAGSVAVLSGAQGVGYTADSLVMPRCRSLISDRCNASRTLAPATQMHNGCFPGTPSSFANMCLSKMVKPDVDLLFIECVVVAPVDPASRVVRLSNVMKAAFPWQHITESAHNT